MASSATVLQEKVDQFEIDIDALKAWLNDLTGTLEVPIIGGTLPSLLKTILAVGATVPTRGYVTEAALLADLTPGPSTLAFAIDTQKDYVKVGASGAGSWTAGGLSTFAQLFTLAAPALVTFGPNDQIYDDRFNFFTGGSNQLYLPIHITLYKNALVSDNVVVANSASGVSGMTSYCQLSVDDTQTWLIWYDKSVNTYKVTPKSGWGWSTTTIQNVIPIAVKNGSTIVTQCPYTNIYSAVDAIIAFKEPIVVDDVNSKLLVPSLKTVVSSVITDRPPADGSAYSEIAFQTLDLTPNVGWIDPRDGTAKNSSANFPCAPGFRPTTIFARSVKGMVTSQYPIISRNLGNMSMNILPNGDRPINCPDIIPNNVEIAMDDSVMTAAPYNFLWALHNTVLTTSTRVGAGDKLPITKSRTPYYVRLYLTLAPGDTWDNKELPEIQFFDTAIAQPVAVSLRLEKIVSARTRMFSLSGRVPTTNFSLATVINWYKYRVSAWINNGATLDPKITGLQFSMGANTGWIDRSDYPTQQAIGNRVSALEANTPIPPAVDLLYPQDMFLVAGLPYNIYPHTIIPTMTSAKDYVMAVDSLRTGIGSEPFTGLSNGNEIRLDPTRIGPPLVRIEGRRWVDVMGGNNNYYAQEITGHTADTVTADSFPVMGIGDSQLNNDVLNYVKLLLPTINLTPTMVGTINNAGAIGQAIPGVQAAQYTGAVAGKALVTSVSAYLALPDATPGKWDYNAMGEASSGTDSRNGVLFNLASYFTRYSLPTPKYIYMQLGTNDILGNISSPSTALANIQDAFDIMFRRARLAAPSAHIGIGFPAPAFVGDKWALWTSHYVPAIKWLISYINGKRSGGDTKAWVVPIWAHVSPVSGWVVTGSSNVTLATDAQTGVKTIQQNDGIHPFTPGRRETARAIVSWIATCNMGV